jgi:Transglycosylase-like domain
MALTVIATAAFAGGLSTALLAPSVTSAPPAPPAGIRDTARSALIGSSAPSLAHRLSVIARCESGGDPTAISPDGRYRGKYQFDLRTWRAVNGVGDPALAPEHVQDRLARELLLRHGTAPWPVCGASVAR